MQSQTQFSLTMKIMDAAKAYIDETGADDFHPMYTASVRLGCAICDAYPKAYRSDTLEGIANQAIGKVRGLTA